MAGSWLKLDSDKGMLNSAYTRPMGIRYEFTADSTDGSIPDLVVEGAGFVFGIDVVFDSTTVPNELTLVMKSKYGNAQWSPAKLTASGFLKPDSPESAPNTFILTAAQTAVATNSAKGIVTVHMG